LHTNDATGAVVRLIDMGVPPYLLSSALRASLAQRLVRVLCSECRESCSISAEEMESLGGSWAEKLRGKTAWKPKGCPACLGGYRGRTGLYELMLVSPEIQEAIRTAQSIAEFRRLARLSGMRDLMDDGLDKILSGQTSVAEVLRAVGRSTGGPA
ncbi:MAG: ATPase, T2SS/T4P/T4SS family, partial [Lentisphaerota bacterium]